MKKLWQFVRHHYATLAMLGILLGFGISSFIRSSGPSEQLSDLTTQISKHQVVSATLNSGTDIATVQLSDGRTVDVPYAASYEGDLIGKLIAADARVVTVHKTSLWSTVRTIVSIAIVPILFLGVYYIMLSGRLFGRNISKKPVEPPKERFVDVKGAKEAVAAVQLLCDYLRDPRKFLDVGEEPQRGLILDGNPGTGKTLLARALAGEAGVPFYFASGADFVTGFVGQTTVQVRAFFDALPENEPCVVFIDEIDGIASTRGQVRQASDRDGNGTVTQLLTKITEVFVKNPYIVIIAATNRYDDLDPAIKRPEGRLGFRISMPDPDQEGRVAILRAKTLPLKRVDAAIDFEHIARLLVGKSGADVASIPNKAAQISRRQGDKSITAAHYEDAIMETVVGMPRTSVHVSPQDERVTAAHEAGHTTVALVTEKAGRPHRVTIIPAGNSGGGTWSIPEDRLMGDKAMYRARLAVLMGGNEAERLLLEDLQVTTGCSDDLKAATQLALHMVCEAGMGGDSDKARSISVDAWEKDPDAAEINRQVTELLEAARAHARHALVANRPLLEALRDQLIEHKTLKQDAIRELEQAHDRALFSADGHVVK